MNSPVYSNIVLCNSSLNPVQKGSFGARVQLWLVLGVSLVGFLGKQETSFTTKLSMHKVYRGL